MIDMKMKVNLPSDLEETNFSRSAFFVWSTLQFEQFFTSNQIRVSENIPNVRITYKLPIFEIPLTPSKDIGE